MASARTVVVGVSAGIAAYKAAILVRELIRAGLDVHVVPTPRSLDFVGKATWDGLTGRPTHVGVTDHPGTDHVELAREADLIVIAPATADLIARIRAGFADDLLTTTVLASHCPVLIAPAMHTNMWTAPATRDNVAALETRGIRIIGPDTGALGSGDQGLGRLVAPESIAQEALRILDHAAAARPLTGQRVLVSAGGTREPIDPVRFIGNASSGRQGIAIAMEAARQGGEVVLVASNIDAALLNELDNTITLINAPRAKDVEEAVMSRLDDVDVVVMATAVADFRPQNVADSKIKKNPDDDSVPAIELERTIDVLYEVAHCERRPRVLVGFAAETGTPDEVLAFGRLKASRKNADLLAVNRVGGGYGFGDVKNEIHVLSADGNVVAHIEGTKEEVAESLVQAIIARLSTLIG